MNLKEWLQRLVYNYLIAKFTRDNLRQLFRLILNSAKERANSTETLVDDWAIEAFENYIENDERFNRLYEFLERYLIPNKDGICMALPVTYQYIELVEELNKPTAEELEKGAENTCKAVDVKFIVAVFQAVIPILIDLWQRTKE